VNAALLDVNVLVALFDPAHLNHEQAHAWLGAHRRHGWATCPLTVNGCVRVLSSPAYPSFEATAAEVADRLRTLCAAPEHQFWKEGISLLDERRFRRLSFPGPQQITDVYLLGLAVHHNGRLVTFDRSIPLKAVPDARPAHLEVLG